MSKRAIEPSAAETGPTGARPASQTVRWLLLVHHLPAQSSNLRVRTWRRLQQIGAIPARQGIYVLPDSPETREDFEWLKAEIEAARGEATVFAAQSVDAWSDDGLIEEFRRSRQQAYEELAGEAEAVLRAVVGRRRGRKASPRGLVRRLRERLAAIERIDYFASAGRDRVVSILNQLEQQVRAPKAPARPAATDNRSQTYAGRLWVTRPRPGVDRMASAWLIRRFIAPEARFDFVADRDSAPREAVPFDMFGVEFTHRGTLCTFEVLCETFALRDAALAPVAAIVHDLDLKDEQFTPPEAPTVGSIVDGLRLAHEDDQTLLAEGMVLFEALYRAFRQTAHGTGPRAVARKRGKRRSVR
ncbi:MAG: chromate resistance protein [Acidobacteria bacterium]|nr:chromate resistance protein [Acidobacteriota bacterium]